MAINIDQLASSIVSELNRYAGATKTEINGLAKKVATDGAAKLTTVSPLQTGSYRTGWTVKKVKDKYVVHNKTNYQLTHLLEFGHAKINGGRVAARPHIANVEQDMIEEFLNGVKEIVQG